MINRAECCEAENPLGLHLDQLVVVVDRKVNRETVSTSPLSEAPLEKLIRSIAIALVHVTDVSWHVRGGRVVVQGLVDLATVQICDCDSSVFRDTYQVTTILLQATQCLATRVTLV